MEVYDARQIIERRIYTRKKNVFDGCWLGIEGLFDAVIGELFPVPRVTVWIADKPIFTWIGV